MNFTFGLVVSTDMWDCRLMLIAPQMASAFGRLVPVKERRGPVWYALVLRDGGGGWEIGSVVSLAENDLGLSVVEDEGL